MDHEPWERQGRHGLALLWSRSMRGLFGESDIAGQLAFHVYMLWIYIYHLSVLCNVID